MIPTISDDALAVLHAYIEAAGILGVGDKIVLAAQVDGLLAHGWDVEELTRAIQRYATTHKTVDGFALWAERSKPRCWWSD